MKKGEPPDGMNRIVSIYGEAVAWMALGDLDRAAKAVGSVSAALPGYVDPCGLEPLAPLRLDASNQHVLSFCPSLIN